MAAPHVVLIGIDSLRCDVTSLGSGESLTPRIDEFLATDRRGLGDVTSPLARTFPAWMSTLTGRHPASTNARFNLMPRAKVAAGDTLADALRDAGYSTIYSTDEVRFANIDESYGFDQLMVTPPIGASDFVLGTPMTCPCPNLLSATPLGAWLFPHTFANRAAHVTYRPDRFAKRLFDSVDFDRPTFLAIHLTLAHWPYSWAGLEKPRTPDAFRRSYTHAVKAVDDQFAAIMAGLEEAASCQCHHRGVFGSWRGARRPHGHHAQAGGDGGSDLVLGVGPRHQRHEPTPVPGAHRRFVPLVRHSRPSRA
jgi:hypothetical protein